MCKYLINISDLKQIVFECKYLRKTYSPWIGMTIYSFLKILSFSHHLLNLSFSAIPYSRNTWTTQAWVGEMIIINLGLVKWEGPAGLGNESKRVRVKTGHFRKAGQCGSSTKTHQHGLECSIFSFQLLKPVVKTGFL